MSVTIKRDGKPVGTPTLFHRLTCRLFGHRSGFVGFSGFDGTDKTYTACATCGRTVSKHLDTNEPWRATP